MASDLDSQVTEIIELLEPSVVFFAGLDSRSTHLQTRLPVSGQNGFGDQREEVGFREKVPLVPVVGKAAEIERAVLPTIYGFRVGNRAVAYSALYHNSFSGIAVHERWHGTSVGGGSLTSEREVRPMSRQVSW